MQRNKSDIPISFGEEGIGHNKKILLDGRFQSFRVSYGTAEGFPERGGRKVLFATGD